MPAVTQKCILRLIRINYLPKNERVELALKALNKPSPIILTPAQWKEIVEEVE
jgi:hypothetical protein